MLELNAFSPQQSLAIAIGNTLQGLFSKANFSYLTAEVTNSLPKFQGNTDFTCQM